MYQPSMYQTGMNNVKITLLLEVYKEGKLENKVTKIKASLLSGYKRLVLL